jgi:hypothetical protein
MGAYLRRLFYHPSRQHISYLADSVQFATIKPESLARWAAVDHEFIKPRGGHRIGGNITFWAMNNCVLSVRLAKVVIIYVDPNATIKLTEFLVI